MIKILLEIAWQLWLACKEFQGILAKLIIELIHIAPLK